MKRKFYVNARVNEEEHRILGVIARREGINKSETLRIIIRRECKRRDLTIGLETLYVNNPDLAEVKKINSPTTRIAPSASTLGAANPETICNKQIISNCILPQARIIEPLLEAPDVAKLFSVSRTEAYRLMSSNIPVVRFGATTVRGRIVDLEEYINLHIRGGHAR